MTTTCIWWRNSWKRWRRYTTDLFTRQNNNAMWAFPSELFFLSRAESAELSSSRKRHLHHHHHPECHDGRSDTENSFPGRSHGREPRPGHSYQAAALPGPQQPGRQAAMKTNRSSFVVHLLLTSPCHSTPVGSGARLHHAGSEEESVRQWAVPLPGPSGGDSGAHRSVPHEEAGEDDQKRSQHKVPLYHCVLQCTNRKLKSAFIRSFCSVYYLTGGDGVKIENSHMVHDLKLIT